MTFRFFSNYAEIEISQNASIKEFICQGHIHDYPIFEGFEGPLTL